MDWGFLAGVIAALVVVWAAIIALLWVLKPKDARLRNLVRVVPDVLKLVRNLIKDGSAPLGARVAVVGLLLWLLNPIDLIPEFIPVLGPLDDVVVAVLVLRYVHKRLGPEGFRRRWPGSQETYDALATVL